MTPDFQRIIEVCSSQLGNRDTQTDRQNDYHNPIITEKQIAAIKYCNIIIDIPQSQCQKLLMEEMEHIVEGDS